MVFVSCPSVGHDGIDNQRLVAHDDPVRLSRQRGYVGQLLEEYPFHIVERERHVHAQVIQLGGRTWVVRGGASRRGWIGNCALGRDDGWC